MMQKYQKQKKKITASDYMFMRNALDAKITKKS